MNYNNTTPPAFHVYPNVDRTNAGNLIPYWTVYAVNPISGESAVIFESLEQSAANNLASRLNAAASQPDCLLASSALLRRRIAQL